MVLPIVQYMCDELTLQVSTRNIEIANFACYSWVPPPPQQKKNTIPRHTLPSKKNQKEKLTSNSSIKGKWKKEDVARGETNWSCKWFELQLSNHVTGYRSPQP